MSRVGRVSSLNRLALINAATLLVIGKCLTRRRSRHFTHWPQVNIRHRGAVPHLSAPSDWCLAWSGSFAAAPGAAGQGRPVTAGHSAPGNTQLRETLSSGKHSAPGNTQLRETLSSREHSAPGNTQHAGRSEANRAAAGWDSPPSRRKTEV